MNLSADKVLGMNKTILAIRIRLHHSKKIAERTMHITLFTIRTDFRP